MNHPTSLLRLANCLFFVIFFLGSLSKAHSQDLHYSQFYLNLLHLCPAATGVFKGDMRVSALYRNQWKTVPVAYETFSGAVEWKTLRRQSNLISTGLLLEKDQAGDAGLSWLQVGGTLGIAHAISENNVLSLGFGLAFVQRSFDIGRLKFKNQWGGDTYDPSLPSKESFNGTSGFAPTLSTGFQWHFEQTQNRNSIDAGVGLSHINKPKINFSNFADAIPSRTSFFVNSFLQVNARYDLAFVGEWQTMAKAKELVFGTGIRCFLTTGIANETILQLMIAQRLGDALIPSIQLSRNNWTLGLSYDLNVSAFDKATNGRGGMEIAVIWRRIPVPELKTAKSCPVF